MSSSQLTNVFLFLSEDLKPPTRYNIVLLHGSGLKLCTFGEHQYLVNVDPPQF